MRVNSVQESIINRNSEVGIMLEPFFKYYLRPYDSHESGALLSRPHHGLMHVSRVAFYVEVLHDLHRIHQNPATSKKIKKLTTELHITEKDLLNYTVCTAFLHDVARKGDGPDKWDKDSAKQAKDLLIQHKANLPIKDPAIAHIFSEIIHFKDAPKDYQESVQAYLAEHKMEIDVEAMLYLHSLIHDADVIDVMRVRSRFDISYLYCSKLFSTQESSKDLISLIGSAGKLIEDQNDAAYACILHNPYSDRNSCYPHKIKLIQKRTYDLEEKQTYEHADNPYIAVTKDFTYQQAEPTKKVEFNNSLPFDSGDTTKVVRKIGWYHTIYNKLVSSWLGLKNTTYNALQFLYNLASKCFSSFYNTCLRVSSKQPVTHKLSGLFSRKHNTNQGGNIARQSKNSPDSRPVSGLRRPS